MSLLLVLFLAPGPLAVPAPGGAEGGEESTGTAVTLAELDSLDPESWSRSLEALVALGDEAALEALAGFAGADVRGRRARARLVVEVGSPASIEGVLALLGSSDPEVRRLFARFLGLASLGERAAEERAGALGRLAREDPARTVRAEALASLGASGLPAAAGALDALLEELPSDEAAEVATALGVLPQGRQRVRVRVRRAFSGDWVAPAPVLAALVVAYGRALAEAPGGGEERGERAPFLAGERHPDVAVRRAARAAFEELFVRVVDQGELERADRLFALFQDDGWRPRELLYRRTYLTLSRRATPQVAFELADELVRAASIDDGVEGRTWRFYGLHFRAVAAYARGDAPRALKDFEAAEAVLRELLGEREDLRRGTLLKSGVHPLAPAGGAVLVDRLLTLATVELWQAVAWLTLVPDPSHPTALARLREAHEVLLSAQLLALHTDVEIPPDGWDAVLDRDLAPRRLCFANRRLDPEAKAVDVELRLGRALATVSPWEVPGFEPASTPERALSDPIADPARFHLLRAIQEAEWGQLERRLDRLRSEGTDLPGVIRGLRLRRAEVMRNRALVARNAASADPGELDREERRTAFGTLLDYRSPSLLALDLAAELRAEGRAGEGRALVGRGLAQVRAGLPGTQSAWTEWASARIEMSIASSLMDENRPREAEATALEAVGRLEALENTLVQRIEEAGTESDRERRLVAYLEQTRIQRAGALLSLAVNANVRLGEPERALGFFERAYEYDQSDFMRVLLACYRARSGRAEEARAVLRGVRPAPRLYYNLACTHALLGEPDLALDYLQREFEENHQGPGSLARQKGWASEDPDLRSLRGDPRFERLTGGG